MQSLFVFMSLTELSAKTEGSILNAVAYMSQLESKSEVEATLFVFDKTNRDLSSLPTFKHFGDRIRFVSRDPNETLMGSVAHFGSELCEEASWVQVLAEDDFFAFSEDVIWHPEPHVSMAVPDIAFLGKGLQLELSNETHRGAMDGIHFAEGDSSWHALTRGDVFRIYCRWLGSFSSPLHSFSSCAGLMSAALGTVVRLEGVLYVKEASLYDKPKVIEDRTRQNFILATGSDSLDGSSAIFYLAAKLSLLEYGRNLAPNGKWDSVIEIVLADAMNHIDGKHLGRWDRMKYLISPSQESLHRVFTTRIPSLYKGLEGYFEKAPISIRKDSPPF